MHLQEEFRQVLHRLVKLSNEDEFNPFDEINWDVEIPNDTPWISHELMSIHGTSWEDSLTREQIVALSKWECVNFFSLNVTGIRELLQEMMGRIHTLGYELTSEYLHHLIAEENEHMWYFSRFCLKFGGKIYNDRAIRFDSFEEADIRNFLTFTTILIFEEIVDFYNKHMGADEGLPPLIKQLNRLHHLDETRHIAYGRLNAELLYHELRDRYDEDRLREIEHALKRFMLMSMQKMYNVQIYRDACIPNPLGVRKELLGNASRIHFNERVLAKTAKFFAKTGIFANAELSL